MCHKRGNKYYLQILQLHDYFLIITDFSFQMLPLHNPLNCFDYSHSHTIKKTNLWFIYCSIES